MSKMTFEEAQKVIKYALALVISREGPNYEQKYLDAFTALQEYIKRHDAFDAYLENMLVEATKAGIRQDGMMHIPTPDEAYEKGFFDCLLDVVRRRKQDCVDCIKDKAQRRKQ